MIRVDTRMPKLMVSKIDALKNPGQTRADVVRSLLWTRLRQIDKEKENAGDN